MQGPDYILDIAALRRARDQPAKGASMGGVSGGAMSAGDGEGAAAGAASDARLRGRPWLAIRWRCCEVYSRVYRNAAGTAYEARCPRCGRDITVAVDPRSGTRARFFEAR